MLKIGAVYNSGIKINSAFGILRNSSSFDTAFVTTCNNINYIFCRNKASIINFIGTLDINFKTKEGISIGTSFERVKQLSKGFEIRAERGWAIFVALPSGWNASFGLPDEYSRELKIADSARVVFFFKR